MIDKSHRDAVFSVLKDCQFSSLRLEDRREQTLQVESGVYFPLSTQDTVGVQISVVKGKGYGYASTQDLTVTGLQKAAIAAKNYADLSSQVSVCDYSQVEWDHHKGEWSSQTEKPWSQSSIAEIKDLISPLVSILNDKTKEFVVDNEVVLWSVKKDLSYFTNEGGEIHQAFEYFIPMLGVTGQKDHLIQSRTFGGHAHCRQGGLEWVNKYNLASQSHRIVEELEQLLHADNCPEGEMDIVIAPDQMILQIHESIGHPIEMDRILGDERNYAGTSFVTNDMFGSYQYGSELLNVSFDPSMDDQLASYGYDDEGHKAEKVLVIEKGILKRPLGGVVSQARSGMPCVANSRSTHWNRAPIDRMANLNLENGDESFSQLVSKVEDGVYLETNCSWSIDDSRNKFQFGCEYGRRIKNGELAEVVRNPNYRGWSSEFWRNLDGVGTKETMQVMGTPFCGKGEPNQAIYVGHASPSCRFKNISVFGGM